MLDVACALSPENEAACEANPVSPLSPCRRSTSSHSLPSLSIHGPPGTDSQHLAPSSLRSYLSCPDMAIKPARLQDDTPSQEIPMTCIMVDSPEGDNTVRPEPEDPCDLLDTYETMSVVPSLEELSRLLRAERYQRRRSKHSRRMLLDLQAATARTERLLAMSQSVRLTLAECIRSEDKNSFASLYNFFQQSYQELARAPASLEPCFNANCHDEDDISTGFFAQLSLTSRSTLLVHLDYLRNDGDFLADRIASLSHKELLALLPEPGIFKASDSVFGHSQRASSRSSRPLGYTVDRLLDDLAGAAARSPLALLVHGLHGSTFPLAHPDSTATDVWATVCARLIADKKPGNERLITALLDLWSTNGSWHGKERMQLWITQTLTQGHFLLEQPVRQTFRSRVQGQQDGHADEVARNERFYSDSAAKLLDLFAKDPSQCQIPDGAIALCKAIYTKLHPSSGHQEAFPSFITTRWLFLSFIPDILTLPESKGLLYEHYISENARQRILREVLVRAQRTVSDVVYARYGSITLIDQAMRTNRKYSKYTNIIPTQAIDSVQSIMANFQFSDAPAIATSTPTFTQPRYSSGFFTLTATDVLGMLNAVSPVHRPQSLSSDQDTLRSGLQSSASSVSGFSLFKNADLLGPKLVGLGESAPWNVLTSSGAIEEEGFTPELQTHASASFDADSLAELRSELDDLVNTDRAPDAVGWTTFFVSDTNKTSSPLHDPSEPNTLPTASASPTRYVPRSIQPSEWWSAMETMLETTREYQSVVHESTTRTHYDPASFQAELRRNFEQAFLTREAQCDFVNAQEWLDALRSFDSFWQHDGVTGLRARILDFQDSLQQSNSAAIAVVGSCEQILVQIQPRFETAIQALGTQLRDFAELRDKMWYTADVRTSAAYESLQGIARALNIMGKSKREGSARLPPNLRHSTTSKMISHSLPLKSVAQIQDLLSASPERGGPNKLSDEQSGLMPSWVSSHRIRMICIGEERIHKLCMEVRRCAEHLTLTPAAENPMLWSSPLYSSEHGTHVAARPASKNTLNLSSLSRSVRTLDTLTLRTTWTPSMEAMSNASHTLSSASSRDYFDPRSPALTNKSSTTFWSPAMTEAHSPSSATSVGSFMTHAPGVHVQRTNGTPHRNQQMQEEQVLCQRITGLLLSDVALHVFSNGSETDLSFWHGVGGDLLQQNVLSEQKQHQSFTHSIPAVSFASATDQTPGIRFNLDKAFANMFQRFSAAYNPLTKLSLLHDVQKLLPSYVSQLSASRARQNTSSLDASQKEVHEKNLSGAELHIHGFGRLFRDRHIRPDTIFRDLQYIASLVPETILDHSSESAAFWNATVALLRIKAEGVKIMVETADGIIAYHTNNRGHGRSASMAQQQRDSATFSTPSRTPSAGDVARYSMSDAAYLLQITAKEKDAAAQRELATLYLTHPDLMKHIIAPFTRPKDVFREELEGKWKKNQDPARCDPVTMCVAHHWMLLSSKGGDALAKEYLRQREEMERLP